jgi:hypothetical protein
VLIFNFANLSAALSAWSVYSQVIKCQEATDAMQETALNATATRDQVEKIKVTEVLPLFGQIQDQVRQSSPPIIYIMCSIFDTYHTFPPHAPLMILAKT